MIYKKLVKFLTNDFKKIPLIKISINLQKYRNKKENSCLGEIHPILREDEHIENTLKKLIDYIRDNYDIDDLI